MINASNLQSGALWRFSRPYIRDYRVGEIANPTTSLAAAVAASSAFPPFLSPVVLEFPEAAYTPGSGMDLQRPPFTTEVALTDGGVYDNLGLETAWKRYSTILVSDGGGKMGAEEEVDEDWARHTLRVMNLIDNQVRNLRKRQVIGSYELAPEQAGRRDGVYWGIRTDIANYPLADALTCPHEETMRLAEIPTRLSELDAPIQERLINWGYAVCDAAMRGHVAKGLPPPIALPYPDEGVG